VSELFTGSRGRAAGARTTNRPSGAGKWNPGAFRFRRRLACAALLLELASNPAGGADYEQEIPSTIRDRIVAKIVGETTFQQLTPTGLVRWSSRSITLLEFVKAKSPTYPDTYLFALRYGVAVASDQRSLSLHDTVCAVSLVYRDKQWGEPTVACGPIVLDMTDHPS
jgi:hypothetical protein